MDTVELVASIQRALAEVASYRDELRDLDQVLGDGDLGITVSAGATAVMAACDDIDTESAKPSDVLKVCAKAFANANPSTFAALTAGALLAGSRQWTGKDEISVADSAAFIAACADSISARGKSQVGDKTILDALVPAGQALAAHEDDGEKALDAAIDAAQQGVEATKAMRSQRGRASWLQERSVGQQDPGATALLRFLQSWRSANCKK